jgi:hypothetical protein
MPSLQSSHHGQGVASDFRDDVPRLFPDSGVKIRPDHQGFGAFQVACNTKRALRNQLSSHQASHCSFSLLGTNRNSPEIPVEVPGRDVAEWGIWCMTQRARNLIYCIHPYYRAIPFFFFFFLILLVFRSMYRAIPPLYYKTPL